MLRLFFCVVKSLDKNFFDGIIAAMNKHNQTLHKQALQRRRLLRAGRIKGETMVAWAKRLGISRARLYALVREK